MKILLVSNDINLIKMISDNGLSLLHSVTISSENNDPLDIMSEVCTQNPSILILDDDFTRPNSTQLLNSIKKVNKKVSVIFITSDDSIELGRQISPIGIQYYTIKPVIQNSLIDSVKSIINQLQNKNSFNFTK